MRTLVRHWKHRRVLLSCLFLHFVIWLSASPVGAAEPEPCTPMMGRVVSVHGQVQVRRTAKPDWEPAILGTALCSGDLVRTGERGKAALWLSPENLVRLDRSTLVGLTLGADFAEVEFLPVDMAPARAQCGAGSFRARYPRHFRVRTPYLNASVEGTEFLVTNYCTTTLVSVREGIVLATPADGGDALRLTAGESASAGAGIRGILRLKVTPSDQAHWLIHLPYLATMDAVEGLRTSTEACDDAQSAPHAQCARRAIHARLRDGDIAEARKHLDALERLPEGEAIAAPYRAFLALTGLDIASDRTDGSRDEANRTQAASMAESAVRARPSDPLAWTALSYARQAQGRLEDALAAAQRALDALPDEPNLLARVAELELYLDRPALAQAAARQGSKLDPNNARCAQMEGFALLALDRWESARTQFTRAIDLDSEDPMSRLGLALARLRAGEIASSQTELDIAVALDPDSSLLRTYLARTLLVERARPRVDAAARQLALAKTLDPMDPSPRFLDGLRLGLLGRHAESAAVFAEAKALNDRRVPYRSGAGLARDRTAEDVGRAQALREVGVIEPALREAADASSNEPGDAGALRLLSALQEDQARSGASAESSYVQALIQGRPGQQSVDALRPIAAAGGMSFPLQGGLPRDVGSPLPGLYELESTRPRNGLHLSGQGLWGSDAIRSSQVGVNGVLDRIGLSVSAGDREFVQGATGNAFRQDGMSGAIAIGLTPSTTATLVASRGRGERRDDFATFDAASVYRQRAADEAETYRLGLRHQFDSRNALLLHASKGRSSSELTGIDDGAMSVIDQWGDSVEARYDAGGDRFQMQAGAGFNASRIRWAADEPPDRGTHSHAYLYTTTRLPQGLGRFVVGTSFDLQREGPYRRQVFHPKLGLELHAGPYVTLRAATFRNLMRQVPVIASLEPAQFLGFPQMRDDMTGTLSATDAWGADLHPGRSFRLGGYRLARRLDVPLFELRRFTDFDWRDTTTTFYAAWTARCESGASWLGCATVYLENQTERLSRPAELTGAEAIRDLRTRTTALGLSAPVGESGLFRVVGTRVRQEGVLQAYADTEEFATGSRFWRLDTWFGWALPRVSGRIVLGVVNVFDRRESYVETFGFAPRFSLGRTGIVRLELRL